MRRRELIGLIGSAAALPLTVRTGAPLPTLGVLYPGASTYRLDSDFLAGLDELGFVDAQTVTIVYRFTLSRRSLNYSGSPALRRPSAHIAKCSGRWNGVHFPRQEMRNVGSS